MSDDPRSLVVYDTAEEEAVSIVATRNDASLRLRGARGGTEFSGTELKVFDVGAAPGFYHRAQLGKRKGGNYALVFTDPSGSREIAAIGESTERSGMAYVADNAGNELVRLDGGGGRPGVRILNAKGMSIAALAEDSAKTGALILSDASGNARVQAGGTDQGVGVVRALGPDSSKGGPAGLGLPGTYIVGKR